MVTSSNADISAVTVIFPVCDGVQCASVPNSTIVQDTMSTLSASTTQSDLVTIQSRLATIQSGLATIQSDLATLLVRKESFEARVEAKQEYNRFLAAIEDMNRYFHLESSLPALANLQQGCNSTCLFYFIEDTDSKSCAEWKVQKVLLEMKNLSQLCRMRLSRKFGSDFLTKLEPVIQNLLDATTLAGVTEKEKSEVDDIWEELL